jgi:hypothetical protein
VDAVGRLDENLDGVGLILEKKGWRIGSGRSRFCSGREGCGCSWWIRGRFRWRRILGVTRMDKGLVVEDVFGQAEKDGDSPDHVGEEKGWGEPQKRGEIGIKIIKERESCGISDAENGIIGDISAKIVLNYIHQLIDQ